MAEENVGARERVRQERWKAAGLAHARVRPGHPKFSIVFAYPGTSGFMHIGHMRGYTYADAIARFHRMKGEEVFFPAGIHASGLPAITFAGKVANREPDTIEGLKEWGAGEADLARLEDPAEAARFLGETYWKVWERFGMLLDRESWVSTIDPDYQQFIRWQFLRLQRAGKLVQKPYFAPFCPRSGPVSVDASETDLERGGNAEVVVYTGVPFELPDGRRILCATLRPETVYGVTNLWVPSQGGLVEWKFKGRVYLASPAGVAKLLEQWGGEQGASTPTGGLEGKTVRAPLTGATVPIFQSRLVDPDVGSGAVMSVPAHAPADWVALGELEGETGERLRSSAKVLLELPLPTLAASERELFQGEGPPAAQAVRHLRVGSLEDAAALEEATERVYRAEHTHGVMTVDPYRGESVEDARKTVASEILTRESGVEVREFSEPVVCRCGERVVIRQIPEQWFLAYSDKGWKEQVRAHLERMRFYPPEYGEELPGILDWFEDRPAVRKGRWLGTPLPGDPNWIIEPIADSTFYPAYYVVRRFVTAKRLSVEQLTPSFFDAVFRGEGAGECSVPAELVEEVRREFLYFYPLDVNLGGKEHKRVHFPPFLYNHLALLPPELCPRAIFVNWWISRGGRKVSKKDVKGHALPPVDHALAQWGADGLRLYYAMASTSFQDIEWDEATCARAAERAREVARAVGPLVEGLGSWSLPSLSLGEHLDRWFSTAVASAVARTRTCFEENDFHGATQIAYVEVPGLLRRYRSRGGSNSELLRAAGSLWLRLLSPVTPHLAEEAIAGGPSSLGFVAQARFPDGSELPSFPEAEAREGLLDRLEEDVASLLRSWKSPTSELRLFIAAPWKVEAETALRTALRSGATPDVGGAMKVLRTLDSLRSHLGELPAYLKLYDLRELAAESATKASVLTSSEEETVWKAAVPYLRSRFSLQEIRVCPEETAGPLDPKGRRARARPGRPGLFLVEPSK